MSGLAETAWMADRACRNTQIDFFPNEANLAAVERAKQICRLCPVMDECRQYALDTGTEDGIFGGTTGSERVTVSLLLSVVQIVEV